MYPPFALYMSTDVVTGSFFKLIVGIFAHVFPLPSLMFVEENSSPEFYAQRCIADGAMPS